MPFMRGPEAASILRKRGFCGIICGVTGNVRKEDLERFLSSGANFVLPKPLDLKVEDLKVSSCLSLSLSLSLSVSLTLSLLPTLSLFLLSLSLLSLSLLLLLLSITHDVLLPLHLHLIFPSSHFSTPCPFFRNTLMPSLTGITSSYSAAKLVHAVQCNPRTVRGVEREAQSTCC
jgi:CheY-like chemotaxis protein